MTQYLENLRSEVEITSPKEVEAKINDLRKAALAGFEHTAGLEAKFDEVQESVRKLGESVARSQQQSLGDEGELRHYVETDEQVRALDRNAFVKTENGEAVQVRGVFVKTEEGTGYRPGLLDDTPRCAWQRELQEKVEARNLFVLMRAMSEGKSSIKGVRAPTIDAEIRDHLRRAPDSMRIFSSAVAESGAEWIPANYLPTLTRELEVRGVANRLFTTRKFPAGKSLNLPYLKGHIRPFIKVIPTANDPANDPLSSFGTDDNVLTMKSFVTGFQLDRDSDEDSIIAVIPITRERLATAMVNGECDAIWNGHIAGTQDDLQNWNTQGLWGTGDFGTEDHRRAFDGLRRKAIAKGTTLDYTALAAADQDNPNEIIELVKLLDVSVSVQAGAVVIATSMFGFFRMLKKYQLYAQNTGIPSPLVTGVIGPDGTGLPGQVGMLYGRYPIVIDPMLTDDLNASGVYDNVTTTKSVTMAVARERYDRWQRKNFGIETEIDIRNNTSTLVARHRATFAEQAPDAVAEKNVAMLYNVPTQ